MAIGCKTSGWRMDTEYVDGLCLLDEWIKGPTLADGWINGLKPEEPEKTI